MIFPLPYALDHDHARPVEEADSYHEIDSLAHGQHATRYWIADGMDDGACTVQMAASSGGADDAAVGCDEGGRGPAPGKTRLPPYARRPASWAMLGRRGLNQIGSGHLETLGNPGHGCARDTGPVGEKHIQTDGMRVVEQSSASEAKAERSVANHPGR